MVNTPDDLEDAFLLANTSATYLRRLPKTAKCILMKYPVKPALPKSV